MVSLASNAPDPMKPVSGRRKLVALLFLPILAALAPESLAGDVYQGKAVYQNHCKGCHGRSGAGEIGNAPDFTLGEGLLQSDMALMESISGGKGVMPGYRGVLTDEEILDVISYLRALF